MTVGKLMGVITTTDPANLKREASRKLALIGRQLRAHFDQSVVRLGVTRSQWTAIAAVVRYPGATQRTIANLLDITEVSAGRLIDRLCADGLAERRQKDDDKRAHAIFLTESGHNITSQLSDIARENEDVAFAGFRSHDLERLNMLLDTISDNISKT
ncbi:MAG: MarR family winged helix-turn-helix transcriptional regulator [Sphingobium sp.]